MLNLLGFVSLAKSAFFPSQVIEYLGFAINPVSDESFTDRTETEVTG